MKSVAKLYREFKKAPDFSMTKEEFIIWLGCKFYLMRKPYLKFAFLKPPIASLSEATTVTPEPNYFVVEVHWEGFKEYLAKYFIKLEEKK